MGVVRRLLPALFVVDGQQCGYLILGLRPGGPNSFNISSVARIKKTVQPANLVGRWWDDVNGAVNDDEDDVPKSGGGEFGACSGERVLLLVLRAGEGKYNLL